MIGEYKSILLSYCRTKNISENEGIQIIHNSLKGKGYTRSFWKIEKFKLYADERIKNRTATTSSLVKIIVSMPEYKEKFESFFPNKTLDKEKEFFNLRKLLADKRMNQVLKSIFYEKGFDIWGTYNESNDTYNFAHKHVFKQKLSERIKNDR
tara:strand:+ start:37 stop:492 length:456 start_codon:yes stop_codon:yes gene_type:complete